jgi:hypothetical protein
MGSLHARAASHARLVAIFHVTKEHLVPLAATRIGAEGLYGLRDGAENRQNCRGKP